MEFTISCETIKRLSRIAGPDHRFIRMEHWAGNTAAIVSNRKLGVVERIGLNPSNIIGAVHFPLNDGIIAQCEKEAPFNSAVKVVVNSVLQYATATTTLGYSFQGNAMMPEASIAATAFNEWRSWLPPKPITKSNGAMFWVADWIAALAASSPSGRIVFPEFIDVSKPVILRDFIDEKWLGIFMANRILDNGTVEAAAPATLPQWMTGA